MKDEIREKKLTDNTGMLEYSDGGCTSYVLFGKDRAVMIDPGYGLLNGREYAEKLYGCEIPWCADTHGHFDHAGGNEQFDLVFMSKAAEKQAKTVYPSLRFRKYDFSYPIYYLADGDEIDLGGRSLEALLIPNHSPGDVAYLDAENRLLFTGDCIGPFVPMVWQQEDPQPCMETYRELLKKVWARRNEYDYICTGHGEGLLPGEIVGLCLEHVDHILAGNPGIRYEPPKKAAPQNDWKWHGPRDGDFAVFLPEYKRVSHYKGTTIEYDERYLTFK